MPTQTPTKTTDDDPVVEPSARQLTLPLSTVLTGVVAVLGVLAGVVFGLLWFDARADVRATARQAAEDRRAEQVAADYAVGASRVDHTDVDAWVGRLKAGTTAELAARFDATAPTLREILVPMQWRSEGTASTAKVSARSAGTYQVDVYVEVDSTSVQTPDRVRTTVHYAITLDADRDWQIVEVGGTGGALPLK